MAESCPHHLCMRSNAIVKNYTVPKPNENPDEYVSKLVEIVDDEKIDWIIPTCEKYFMLHVVWRFYLVNVVFLLIHLPS